MRPQCPSAPITSKGLKIILLLYCFFLVRVSVSAQKTSRGAGALGAQGHQPNAAPAQAPFTGRRNEAPLEIRKCGLRPYPLFTPDIPLICINVCAFLVEYTQL